jgi:hypothetical protein
LAMADDGDHGIFGLDLVTSEMTARGNHSVDMSGDG